MKLEWRNSLLLPRHGLMFGLGASARRAAGSDSTGRASGTLILRLDAAGLRVVRTIRRGSLCAAVLTGLFTVPCLALADGLTWRTDYGQAKVEAAQSHRDLCVFFREPARSPGCSPLDTAVAELESQNRVAQRFVLAELRLSATVERDGRPLRLLDHPAFAELNHAPGVAILDLSDPTRRTFGYVVSMYPFPPGELVPPAHLSALLDLPPGSLSQRTLIFAVRIHSESPRSTAGEFSPLLSGEAENHSRHQASITLQGHHQWESRFHRINAKLPHGLLAQEVCAESWPGQGLWAAALECVHSWRQSPGHWEAVRTGHPLFAYDMARGRNGVWYATGIFARRDGAGR